jgi:hypothetical protein
MSTVDSVFDGLMQALKLIRYLPPSAVDHLEPRIEDLVQQLRSCSRTNIEKCRELADSILEDLWEESIHTKFFVYPKLIHNQLKEGAIAAATKFSNLGVKIEHIVALPCDEATLDCEAFAPGNTTLISHIENLLYNPFKHYPIEQFKNDIHDYPLAVAYLRLDETQERLLLVVADSANPPARENLWTVKRGLSNVRASMQVFGGDIEFIPAAGGLLNHHYSPTRGQLEECAKRKVDISLYRNLFVTSFPLARQSL